MRYISNYKNYIVIKTFLNNFLTLLNQKQITITLGDYYLESFCFRPLKSLELLP